MFAFCAVYEDNMSTVSARHSEMPVAMMVSENWGIFNAQYIFSATCGL